MTEDVLCVKTGKTVKRDHCERECPRRKVRGGDCVAWDRLKGREIKKQKDEVT